MAGSSTEQIIVKGANENNLKNVDVVIPRDELVVITGLSGSGKSTLAFDTIYAGDFPQPEGHVKESAFNRRNGDRDI